MDFRRGYRKVPVPGKRFRRRQGDVPVVDCRDSQQRVASKDKYRHVERYIAGCRETRGQRHEQHFVSHGVNHRSDDCLEMPAARNESVDKVGRAGVHKKGSGVGQLLVHDEVPDNWRRHESRECQKVWKRVNVFVRRAQFGKLGLCVLQHFFGDMFGGSQAGILGIGVGWLLGRIVTAVWNKETEVSSFWKWCWEKVLANSCRTKKASNVALFGWK